MPQTTLIYTDPKQNNRYLFMIDYNMNLIIYDITNYYDSLDTSQVYLTFDLYSQSTLISDEKSCNNFVLVNSNRMTALCKSNIKAKQAISILINIDIIDLRNPILQLKWTYTISGFSYDTMKDGSLLSMPVPEGLNGYLYWMKENTTNCKFRLIYSDKSEYNTDIKLTIKDFKDPLRYIPGEIDYHSTSCGEPEPIVFDTTHIKYLQIRDIQVVPYFNNVIVATDFNYGVLFWQINCDDISNCTSKELYRVRLEKVGAISVLDHDFNNKENVIFVSQLNPPRIIEILMNQIERPAFISRVYRLGGLDENEFLSLDMIEGNADYILAQLFNIKTLRPLIRIYKRKSSLFQSVYLELYIDDFVDIGLYFKFINPNQNYFILRQSNSFQVYKIQPTYLEINVWGLSPKEIVGYANNITDQVLLNLTLTAKNQTHHSLSTSIPLLITDKDNVNTQALIIASQNGKQQERIQIKYICGETDLEDQEMIIDKYFSGKKNRLVLKQSEDFFELKPVILSYKSLIEHSTKQCLISTLVTFQINSVKNSKGNEYLACSVPYNKSISFTPLHNNRLVRPDFVIQKSNIVAFQYNTKSNDFFILSNQQTNSKEEEVILHIYTLYNIFSWEMTIDIRKQHADLANFTVRQYNQMSFQKLRNQGYIISKETLVGQQILQQIVLFELSDKKIFNWKRFRVFGIINFNFTQQNATPQYNLVVKQCKIDKDGFIWVLLTNSTVIIYQQQQTDNEFVNLLNIKEYQRYQLVNRNNKREQNLTDQVVNNFFLTSSSLILFQGINTTVLHEFELSSKQFLKSMILPMQRLIEDDLDRNTSLEYVICTQTNQVTFGVLGNYLVILLKVIQSNILSGYRFHVYDISQGRHNSLIMRQNLTIDDPRIIDRNPPEIDLQYVRIKLFEVNEKVIGLILALDGQYSAYYEFTHNTELTINFMRLDQLTKRCTDQDASFDIAVYPSDNEQQIVNYTVNAQNKGLVITKTVLNENITLQYQNASDSRQILKTAKYPLLSNFEGHGMNFSQNSCSTQNGIICNDFQLAQRVRMYEVSIDFLSNRNPVVGFFYIDDLIDNQINQFFLFFDQTSARLIQLENGQYEFCSCLLTDLFPFLLGQNKDVIPVIESYKMFEIKFNQSTARYLMTMNNFNQISLSKVLVTKDVQLQDNFVSFNKSEDSHLSIQKGRNFSTTFAQIAIIEAYAINIFEKDLMGALIVYDMPEVLDMSSRIEQHTFDLRDQKFNPSNVSLERNYSFFSVYAERLGIDTFKVTAMAILPETKTAIFALQDLGLVFFNIDTWTILKIEMLKNNLKATNLQINAIIPDTSLYLQLLVKQRGVIVVEYPESKSDSANNPYQYTPYIYDTEGLVFHEDLSLQNQKMLYTTSKLGIAYTEAINGDEKVDITGSERLNLKFYSYSVNNKNKALGNYQFAYDYEKCTALQSINSLPTYIQNKMPNMIFNESMVVAVICDSTLKIIAYNFHPSILITLQGDYQTEVSQVVINVTANNIRSSESYNLTLTVLNQSTATSYWVFIVFILVIGIVLMALQIDLKKQRIQDPSKKPSQSSFIENTTSTFETQGSSFSRKGNHQSYVDDQDTRIGISKYQQNQEREAQSLTMESILKNRTKFNSVKQVKINHQSEQDKHLLQRFETNSSYSSMDSSQDQVLSKRGVSHAIN